MGKILTIKDADFSAVSVGTVTPSENPDNGYWYYGLSDATLNSGTVGTVTGFYWEIHDESLIGKTITKIKLANITDETKYDVLPSYVDFSGTTYALTEGINIIVLETPFIMTETNGIYVLPEKDTHPYWAFSTDSHGTPQLRTYVNKVYYNFWWNIDLFIKS